MAEQNCSSISSPTPGIITTTAEEVKSDVGDSNSLTDSCDSRKFVDKNWSDENATHNNQSPQSYSKLLISEPTVKSCSESRNGFENHEKSVEKPASFLRPSILSSGFSSFTSSNEGNSKLGAPASPNSTKLNLNTPKFGNSTFLNAQTNQKNIAFKSSVSSNNGDSPKNESSKTEKNSAEEQNNSSLPGIFTTTLTPGSTTSGNKTPKTSIISVPNFVFGQNLHERVTDGVKPADSNTATEITSNGTSEMLFTSVLTSKEIKKTLNSDSFGSSKESSSLIEDAARCQEARANKRKYEEVLVTTGEEDEENILQINVKLFAFDNGAWLERGRGILRLNDKTSDDGTSSRIVIRTVGSLRVVLNAKIWNGMSLSRASERSTRLTAIDPNGQVKIFLIQASLKDMTQLYPLLEERIALCKEQESQNKDSPNKKIALEKNEM